MKKVVLLFLVLALFLLPCATVGAQESVDESVLYGTHSVDASVPLLGADQLITNAQSVVLYETDSETLMYAWNADEQLPPSSLVKILTALIAIEEGNLEEVVTVRSDVLDTVPSAAMDCDLQVDEVLTLEQLLYCMMVGSANDAAAVIGDHIAGSQAAFVERMNQYALQLGCTATNFVNVHGLHHEMQYTTARDVTRILAAAVKNEQFCTIFGSINYTVPQTNKSEERYFSSGNYLMNTEERANYYDARVTGGRTGIAENSGRCIAATAEANGLKVISVILGAKSVYEEDGVTKNSFGGFPETTALLNLGLQGYKKAQVIYKDQILKQYPVDNGDCDVTVGAVKAVSTVLPAEVTPADLTVAYFDTSGQLKAPISKGDRISAIKISYGNICLAQSDLVAMNRVSDASVAMQTPQQSDVKDTGWTSALAIVGVVALAAVLVVAGVRIAVRIRMIAMQNRSRRYKRDRRRSR